MEILTAEKLVDKYALALHGLARERLIIAVKEFAKQHVKSALKAANKKAKIIESILVAGIYPGHTGKNCIIDKNSILNAYPENLII